ncbi:hypothetical protein ACLESD_53565, partial [Pyxidicoccus sp. 3LFB2]
VDDPGSAQAALVSASVGLGFAAFAALRRPNPAEPAEEGAAIAPGRKLFDVIPLPFGARGLNLFTDGFSGAVFAQVVLATLALVSWLPAPNDAERPQVLLTGALLTATALVAFVSRGFVAWRLRGSVVTLAVGGGLIALTAVLNRAGRPLPPRRVRVAPAAHRPRAVGARAGDPALRPRAGAGGWRTRATGGSTMRCRMRAWPRWPSCS